ncbi:DUF4062 domain-containing protein [Rhizobium leguminosarum bv. viciae]|uniref:DUF4062 domain-containing protein n=1 Tax=Rhizobium leguminosarum TaxID=384 RepID=UPI00144158F1|nr:DUF4062 domain-containing protein [Rhizobium leguminosarum]NKL73766.1 DUF4062 domain-containing protein [Rhizobium leguminosarum bv. viciae]
MLRRIVKVFLGSPGDLVSERKMAAEIVGEMNKDHADFWNVQIELVGWEDTVAAAGRAQELINYDLDQCEYFVGLMWQRWGTPPGGKYTSGFEEEFERSAARNAKHGSPHISLLFKKPDENSMRDPGKELTKVLEFRRKIVDSKKIYFQEFDTEREFLGKFRRLLTVYVQTILSQDRANEARTEVGVRDEVKKSTAVGAIPEPEVRLLQPEASEFIENLLAERDSASNISAADVARLRLVSSSVKRPGNDNFSLGPHDANLIFSARETFKLTPPEISGLVTSGSVHRESENVPLWGWLFQAEGGAEQELVLQTFVRDAPLRSGLIQCLTQGRFMLRSTLISRVEILEEWLTDELDDVKYAAVGYLEHCGSPEDIELLIPLVSSANSTLSERSLAAAIRVLSRSDLNAAFQLLDDFPTTNIPDRVIPDLFASPAHIERDHLVACLSNRNGALRREAVTALKARRALDATVAEKLLSDDLPIVRYVALNTLMETGRAFSNADVKKLLVDTSTNRGSILTGETKPTGEELFDQFEVELLKKQSRSVLEECILKSTIFDYSANYALYQRYFSETRSQLEKNLEDGFVFELERRLNLLKESIGSENDLIVQFKGVATQVLRRVCARALSILCNYGDRESLPLIRSVMDRDEPPFSIEVVKYLERFGGWEDVQRLADLMKRLDHSNAEYPPERQKTRLSEALLEFGKDRTADLFGLDLTADTRALVLAGMTNKSFKELKDGAILKFMSDESTKVRKAVSLKSIISLPIKRQSQLLNTYLSKDGYRYYNVIYWLDAGVRTDRSFSKALAQREMPSLRS